MSSSALSSSSSASLVPTLVQLPNSLLVSVLSFLPLSDLTSSSSICALFFVLTQEDSLWREWCLRRWRHLQPYLKYRLLSNKEWATADGRELGESDEEKEPEKQPEVARLPVGERQTDEGEEDEEDEEPSILTEGGWKARYIACEMDLCRSLLTLPELLSHRWQFRFHFAFDDEHTVTYPQFTEGLVRTGRLNEEHTYPWKWTSRDRLPKSRPYPALTEDDSDDDSAAYVRAGFITQTAMDRILVRPRGPYWLRSCGSLAAILSPSAPPVDPTVAVAAPVLAEKSALKSAALPAHRYVPGWPFFTPTALQVKNCRTVRGLQVSHFPPASISRLPDGGWQMMNQYVVMHTVNSEEEEEEVADDAEDAEEWEALVDVDEREEGEGEEGEEDVGRGAADEGGEHVYDVRSLDESMDA